MFQLLQSSAADLSLDDSETKFPGFDFNNDKHAHVADVLVTKLNRFTNIRGALENSHSIVSISHYRKMLEVYEPISQGMKDRMDFRPLGAAEITAILGK